jgi:PIN domain nuclease of toxin-antitoxin system
MGGLLLDTHIFLWWAMGSFQLPSSINDLINRHYEVYLSSVVAWEIEIKQAKGTLPGDAFDWPSILSDKQLIPLAISFEHVTLLRNLPLLHRDPFDRLLLAQAKSENLQLLTHDADILRYPDVSLLNV